MKALFISNDPLLFDVNSSVRARMRVYADAIGELHILSQAPKGTSEITEGALTLHPLTGGKLFALARMKEKAREIIQVYGIQVVSAQDPFEHGTLAKEAVQGTSAKLHIQIHTDFLSPWFVKDGGFRAMRVHIAAVNSVRVRMADQVLPSASGIRVVSKRIKDSLTARYGDTLPEATVIPIAVNPTMPPAVPLPPPVFPFSLLTAARLEPEKRIEDVLMALGRIAHTFPSAGLYVVGEGSERKRLETLAKKLGLEKRVVFLGWRNDVRGLMQSAHAYIQASAYEGYGLALVEAALARIPIITTDVGIVGEVFKGYEDVLAVPPADPAALAVQISGLISDHQARTKLVMSAEHTVRNHLAALMRQPQEITEDLARLI